MIRIKSSFTNIPSVLFGILLYIIITVLGYTYMLSLDVPVHAERQTSLVPNMSLGEQENICWLTKYDRDVVLDINTEIRHDINLLTTYEPMYKIMREKGDYIVCRDFFSSLVDGPGTYTIDMSATMRTPPFWVSTFKLDHFKVNVE